MQSSTLAEASADSTASLETSRRVARDVLPLIITIAAGVICYGLLVNRGIGLPILGYSISPSERVIQGEVPYRDFIYNYTPGVLWLNAGLIKLLGANLLAINYALFVFKLSTLIAVFYIARRLTSANAALVAVALTLAWIGYRVVFRPYPTQYSMLFVLLGLICVLNYDRSEKLRWLVLCGACAGVVFLFKQNVGVLILGSASGSILVRELLWRDSSPGRVGVVAKRVAICWAGFALICAPMFVYIADTGAFSAMLSHFVSLGGEYGDKRAIPLPNIRLLAPALVALLSICLGGFIAVRKLPRLLEAFILVVLVLIGAVLFIPGRAYAVKGSATAAIFYFPAALFIVAFVIVAWQLKSQRRSGDSQMCWRNCGLIVMVGLFSLGAYLEMYPRADYAHLVRILPPVFLLLLVLVGRSIPVLTSHFNGRLPHPRRAALLCGAAALIILFLVGVKDAWQPRFDSKFRFVEQTPLKIERASGILVSRRQAGFIEQLTAAIEAHSSAGESMFSFAPRGTAFYFLAARRNPTQFVWWRSVGIKKEDREALFDKIVNGIPKLVLVPDGFHNERILEGLGERYHQIDTVGDIAIYDRNQ